MPGTDEPVLTTDPAIQADAVEYAKAALRAKNIKEFKSVLNCAGLLCFPNGVAIQSGINVEFVGKGIYNGKWIIEKEVLHITENKFVTELELRKCIDPAPTAEIVSQVDNDPDPDPDPDSETGD
jgi:hypothetical protein